MEQIKNYEIADEILLVLRSKELEIPKFHGTSSQLCYRRLLIDWLAVISEKLFLSHGILHLSVVYMDTMMEKWEFSKRSQLNLLALCCLWIAAKLDETDNRIPLISTLKCFVANSFEQDDFMQMELNIMQSLDWRLLLPTSVHFLDLYLSNSICLDDLHVGYKITSTEKYKVYIQKYAFYFLEVSLQDHYFNDFLPSLVASAAISASRICLKLTPSWNQLLETMTGYSESCLTNLVNFFLRIHQEDQQRPKSVQTKTYLYQDESLDGSGSG
ncbi:cyclin-J isoform X2 [Hydra vulgaris]|uniref:Cyclin-J isoform X2 n=1 Tax=Hydra vulgaris TaxID=6087 RepID=A0ABM4BLK3_HYDVU